MYGITVQKQDVAEKYERKKTGPRPNFRPGPFIKEKQAEVHSGRLAINFD